ncbi:GntR family transcriptional regulator [Peribacillus sp. NPDC006672]|uniref:GntR family transcriptional regulator n=1 Tax=Peribacillus sp. NPDC006672 TaxID=3390606 RepID=UPI003CFFEDEE
MENVRKIVVEKSNPLPLYFQLKEVLKEKIEKGIYKSDDPIPSERELIDMYGISRTPVRQALNELVAEGLLRREHGRGTFVAHQKIDQMFLKSLSSFGDEMEKKGLSFETELLNKQIIEINSTLQEIFGETHKSFYRIDRLRYIEKDPYVLVTTYIPAAMAPGLLEEDLERNSLYRTLESKYGYNISYAKRVMEAINVAEEDAKILKVSPMAAVQMTKTTAFQIDSQAFEYSIARYRGDLSKFTVEVKYERKQ